MGRICCRISSLTAEFSAHSSSLIALIFGLPASIIALDLLLLIISEIQETIQLASSLQWPQRRSPPVAMTTKFFACTVERSIHRLFSGSPRRLSTVTLGSAMLPSEPESNLDWDQRR